MKRFTAKGIAQTKQQVREELSDIPLEQRITVCLEKISGLGDDVGNIKAQMLSYVYLMSCLVHHERHGGLRTHEINGLQKKAIAILRINQVKTEYGKLSFLYDELDLVLSQIDRKAGDHLNSLWRQSLVARGENIGGAGFSGLASGIRHLRRGNAGEAAENFADAALKLEPGSGRDQSLLGLVKSLRLANFLQLGRDLAQLLSQSDSISTAEGHTELEWETSLIQFQLSHDPLHTLRLLRKQGPHYDGEYLLEYKLWSDIFPDQFDPGRIPKLSTLYRHQRIDLTRWKTLYRIADGLELFRDTEIPLRLRLRNLGEVINEVSDLLMVDHVLLSWAAISRTLERKRIHDLARVPLREYESLSFRLSSGHSRDALGMNAAKKDFVTQRRKSETTPNRSIPAGVNELIATLQNVKKVG